jgi:hypothetical protein
MASTVPSYLTPTSNSNPTDPAIDLDVPEIARSQPYSGPMRARTQLALSLPPLYKLSDIYKSLADKAIGLGLDQVLEHLGERQLRVVTVCSGTEAPLLALEMVKDSELSLAYLYLFGSFVFILRYVLANICSRFTEALQQELELQTSVQRRNRSFQTGLY